MSQVRMFIVVSLVVGGIAGIDGSNRAGGQEPSASTTVSHTFSDDSVNMALSDLSADPEDDGGQSHKSLARLLASAADELEPIRREVDSELDDAELSASHLVPISELGNVAQVKAESYFGDELDDAFDSPLPRDDADQRSESTRAHLSRLRKPVGHIRIGTGVGQREPADRASGYSQSNDTIMITALGLGSSRPQRYTVGFKHRPLYFEQPVLERCGRGCGHFQNVISGARFVASTVLLPYHLCRQRPGCPVANGGDCLTCEPYSASREWLPLNCRALATESAALAGFTFLLM